MGSSYSQPKTATEDMDQQFLEKQPMDTTSDVEVILQQLGLDADDVKDTSSDFIVNETLKSWESDFCANPKNSLAQSAIAKNEIYKVISDTSALTTVNQQYLFNTELKTIGSPSYLDNQKLSGRCWMFATSNILRTHVINNYNLKPDGFQVSQAYLFFYDKLERANFALDNLLDTCEEDLDSRIVSFILNDPIGDGGQWDMIVNILEKYGIVPNEFFPDNAQATASSTLNYILKEKIREYALALRKLKAEGTVDIVINSVKRAMMKQIYNIVCIALGTPPKSSDTFAWEFIDKDGNFKSFNTSPLDFYKKHVRYDATKYFSLIHDPRNPSGQLYTVDRLNNMSNGRPIQYVNTTLESMKTTAIRMIKANEPVFFGCDVGKFYDRQTGVLDVAQYNFELGFGTGFKIGKKERLQTGSSAMTHAMVLTGVHLDEAGNPVRWKIQNSWGGDVGDKGFFVMTDAWFDEYVFQVVTCKAYASKDDYSVWKNQEYTVLPFYDPMGALA